MDMTRLAALHAELWQTIETVQQARRRAETASLAAGGDPAGTTADEEAQTLAAVGDKLQIAVGAVRGAIQEVDLRKRHVAARLEQTSLFDQITALTTRCAELEREAQAARAQTEAAELKVRDLELRLERVQVDNPRPIP